MYRTCPLYLLGVVLLHTFIFFLQTHLSLPNEHIPPQALNGTPSSRESYNYEWSELQPMKKQRAIAK
jgi:hypothetical protein